MKTAAGFVIFRRLHSQIEYLLLQTSYGIHHWTPPKGHVDPGETDELDTAFRETEEEAGLKKSDLIIYNCDDVKKELFYNVNGEPKRVIYWLAEMKDPIKQIKLSEEHQDFKWLKLQDACQLAYYDEMKNMLQYFHNYITNM